MYVIKRFLVATILSLASLTAMAQEPAGPDSKAEEAQRLREEIRERKQELREDQRELREQEREQELARRKRLRPGPGWFNVGLNVAHVDQGEENCFGGQGGLTLGGTLMVRLQHSEISYESDDDTNTCDGLFGGDSQGSDDSVMAGLVLGSSGFFVAAGPSLVDIERTSPGAWGGDTGTRYELGWNSRQSLVAPVGFEVVLFKNENDVRDFHGVAVNFVFGPREEAPRPKARKAVTGRF